MQHNKNTEFVMYVDNFLEKETLISLQNNLSLLEYSQVKTLDGDHYGMRHTFPKSFHDDSLLKIVKEYFFPHRNLKVQGVHAHIRNNTKEPLFHIDDNGPDTGGVACANFLLFVKGKPLLNNGTGFLYNHQLSSHVGFIENRALFFNGSKIYHSDLQSFGDSSERYTLNVFYYEDV
jgi:hypothetical protein